MRRNILPALVTLIAATAVVMVLGSLFRTQFSTDATTATGRQTLVENGIAIASAVLVSLWIFFGLVPRVWRTARRDGRSRQSRKGHPHRDSRDRHSSSGKRHRSRVSTGADFGRDLERIHRQNAQNREDAHRLPSLFGILSGPSAFE